MHETANQHIITGMGKFELPPVARRNKNQKLKPSEKQRETEVANKRSSENVII